MRTVRSIVFARSLAFAGAVLAFVAGTAPEAEAQIRGENGRNIGVRGEGTRGLSGREKYPDRPGQADNPHVEVGQPIGLGGTGVRGVGTPARRALGAWERWWDLNQDALLYDHTGAAAAASAPAPAASSGAGALMRGRSSGPRGGRPPGIQDEIVLSLLERLDGGESDEVVGATLVALARVADADRFADVATHLERALKTGTAQIKPLAALSLGVFGDRRAVPMLVGVLRDDLVGREAVGRQDVPSAVRQHAAIALGLLGGTEVVTPLAEIARGRRDADRDVRACAAAALGLIEGRPAMRAAQALRATLGETRIDSPVVAATAAVSLGKLGLPLVLPDLVDALHAPETDARLRSAVLTAIGRLATLTDPVVEALVEEAEDGDQPAHRQAALLALARIGARDTGDVRARKTIASLLRKAARTPEHDVDRPWGMIALALYARGHADEFDRASDVLMGELRRTNEPSRRAAVSLALALLEEPKAARTLIEDVQDSDEVVRSYAGLALGLLGAAEAEPELLSMLSGSAEQARQAARALAWLSSRAAAQTLAVRVRSPAATWPAAEALGRLRDGAVIPQLTATLDDPNAPAAVRALVATSLGFLGEKTVEPWQTRLLADLDVVHEVVVFAALRET